MRRSRKYGWKKPRGLRTWRNRRNFARGRSMFRRNIDPTLLIAFNNNRSRRNPRSRRNLDPTRLVSFRHRRNLDPSMFTAFNQRQRSHRRHNIDPTRLIAFNRRGRGRSRRRHNIDPRRPAAFGHYRRNPSAISSGRYRRNPDPSGNPWGPKLYNPLVDTENKFKNERHYTKMISKLRRNPW